MREPDTPGPGGTPRDPPDRACWNCAERVATKRLRVETVIHARSGADGGPYHTIQCRGCGAECGVVHLRAPRAGDDRWQLYPLHGQAPAGPLAFDWVGTREERERLQRARGWWLRHELWIRRFSALARKSRTAFPRTESSAPPPRTGRARRRARPRGAKTEPPPAAQPPPSADEDPRPEPEPQASAPPSGDIPTPRELLGVGEHATREEIARAYRAALKRCHPDRVATLDQEFQDLAHRKAKALRVAYETLLRDVD